jgi:hypothetical protein
MWSSPEGKGATWLGLVGLLRWAATEYIILRERERDGNRITPTLTRMLVDYYSQIERVLDLA